MDRKEYYVLAVEADGKAFLCATGVKGKYCEWGNAYPITHAEAIEFAERMKLAYPEILYEVITTPHVGNRPQPVAEPDMGLSRKAQPGDVIKIVEPWGNFGLYEKGDVFTVRERYSGHSDIGVVMPGTGILILDREYVIIQRARSVKTNWRR